jgi:mono/diheme cytochrome c family protein
VNFQFPIQYGAFRVADEYEPGFDVVWPIAGVSDMQGGMFRVRMPIGTVNHATATGGQDLVRAHRLPQDLVGDLLFTEPVGRLIRRTKIVKNEGLTQLRNPYPGSEFVLSTDPLFRPVNIRTAPDGTVYIADMYRGIIQEGQWTRQGSYLRLKIQQYQLDKVINRGRIWRLRFDGTPEFPGTPAGPAAVEIPGQPAEPAIEPDRTQPRMLTETATQLAAHLSHPNGWWRDTAQRLLVLKQDKSIVPTLQTMTRSSENLLARFHAMWTLEGLGALDAALAREQMKDPNPRMRIQAIRASETLYKQGDTSLAEDYRAAAKDEDTDVALQGMLTLNVLKVADAPAVIQATMEANKARGIQEVGKMLLTPPARSLTSAALTAEQQALVQRGETIYGELCSSCHGPDGRGAPMAGAPAGTMMAPALVGSPRLQGHRDYVIKVLLHGLTGPLDDKTYSQVMVPMGQKDDWIAAISTYVRTNFGNSGELVSVADVSRVRAATTNRKTMWTAPELEASLPVLVPVDSAWKVTASENAAAAHAALTMGGWTSAAPQGPGMWLQVEFPEPLTISEVQFMAPLGRGQAPPGAPVTPATAAPARDYEVQVSMDGRKWSAPVARGQLSTHTAAAFAPVRARFVRITQTSAPAGLGPLSIQNIRFYRNDGK